MLTGLNLLNNPFLNKGTAFTKEERAKYGITGMLPSTVQTWNNNLFKLMVNT